MSNDLSPSARKIQRALRDRDLPCQVVELPASTRSAEEAAQAIGCAVGQIAKSLVFRATGAERAILVIVSGSNRVDEKHLADLVGEPIGKADADFVRRHTGFAIGGVPPLGHMAALETFIDEDLLQYGEIWAAAGTPNAVFRVDPAELAKMVGGQVTAVRRAETCGE